MHGKVPKEAVEDFRKAGITIHKCGEPLYERSVATANLLYRFSRPDYAIQPKTKGDVSETVKILSKYSIPFRIKNGGHSYAGSSTAFEGVSLDLSSMKTVDLDMKEGILTMSGGALWGHAYKTLVDNHLDGYVINGGRCPTVGVSGFTLGGGLGPFTRSIGMGVDTLQEVTLILADGTEKTVGVKDDPNTDEGKLFWALCGAGQGNFGVVVEMKTKVRRLRSRDGTVVAGRYVWTPELGPEFIETMRDFYTAPWSDQMTIDSSWYTDLQRTEELSVRFLVYYDGQERDFDREIDKHISDRDLAKQLKRRTLPEKSTRFFHETLVAQWAEEIVKSIPSYSNLEHSIYSSFQLENTDESKITKMMYIIRKEMKSFRKLFPGEEALLQVTFIHSGGAASRRRPAETAFPWRSCTYHMYIMIQWKQKWLERDMRDFLQTFKVKLRPFSISKMAAFINFPDGALSKMSHEKAYFGDNRQELQKIKERWDKDNVFDWDQGVRLPGSDIRPLRAKTANSSAPIFSARMAAPVFEKIVPIARMEIAKDGPEEIMEPELDEEALADSEVVVEATIADDYYTDFDDDNESIEDEPVQVLTDRIAAAAWESFIPAAPVEISAPSAGADSALEGLPLPVFAGGINSLTDLGF